MHGHTKTSVAYPSHYHYFLSPGYIIAIVARLWPALAKSVVLINSGGEVIPYSTAPFTKVSLIKSCRIFTMRDNFFMYFPF